MQYIEFVYETAKRSPFTLEQVNNLLMACKMDEKLTTTYIDLMVRGSYGKDLDGVIQAITNLQFKESYPITTPPIEVLKTATEQYYSPMAKKRRKARKGKQGSFSKNIFKTLKGK